MPGVGDDQHQVVRRAAVPVGGDVDSYAAVEHELAQRRVVVQRRTLEPLDALDVLEHGHVEAEPGYVQEELVLDAADVDSNRLALDGEPGCGIDVHRRCADRLVEIVAGAGGDHPQPYVGSRAENGVGDVRDGPVAA